MALNFEEALKVALSAAKSIREKEIVNLSNSLNRVIATDIRAKRALPPFNNSAMDGYGFRYKDKDTPLRVVKKILAGESVEPILGERECYKIMTGAKVPSDVDTIIPKEFCIQKDDMLYIQKEVKRGNAIRLKGEEIEKGELLLKEGEILTYAKIALLASQGVSAIEVFKPLKIAIVATGSEVKEPWEEANEEEIYNINSINILMALKSFGFESEYKGRLEDSFIKSKEFFKELKREYDLIITTGGISVGDADFTKRALIENGFRALFEGVRVKPGHPTMFGVMERSFIMALPGNPLAAILNFLLLGIPTIFKMQGAKFFRFKECKVKMGEKLTLKKGRANIVLGNIKDGIFFPFKHNQYGSGMIMPLVKSSAIAIFNENIDRVEKNSVIDVVLL